MTPADRNGTQPGSDRSRLRDTWKTAKVERRDLSLDTADGHPFAQVIEYWKSRKGDRAMPLRSDIDPVDLKPALANITLMEVLRDPLAFRYRLAGTHICEIHGHELSGMMVTDLEPAGFGQALHNVLAEIVESGQPQFTEWEFVNRQGIRRNYRVLRLPLSIGGDTVDQILACTDYHGDSRRLREMFDQVYQRERH